jgi:cytochrome c553
MQNIVLIVVAFLSVACSKHEDNRVDNQKEKIDIKNDVDALKLELKLINSVEYLEKYIKDVIINGSNKLEFKTSPMQGGFALLDDAKKISHFVVTLSGRNCTDHEMAKKAQMYYTSNCGGCHGDDGKGLNGVYPDLTKEKLLGIQKREEFLRSRIKKLEHK